MVMTSGQRKRKERGRTTRLSGRTGHRVARLNDSVFVAGGVDSEGLWVNQMHRINGQSARLDSLIMDTGLALEGFSLFSLQENLFVWGGCTHSEYSNQLLQFEGSKFLPLRQQGNHPMPRTDHISVTFGSKYLIVFGGHDHHQFFSDWYLLNITNFQWIRLTPSLELPPCSGGQMVWLSGRGLLLINDFFDESLNMYFPNRLFQFYVSDFERGCLKIVPVPLPHAKVFSEFIFSSMVGYDSCSVLLLGGHRFNSVDDVHNLCFRVFPEEQRSQQLFLDFPKALGFEVIAYKAQLYFLGGQGIQGEFYDGLLSCSLQPSEVTSGYKRHVCEMCKLYFDEEWVQSTKEIYQDSIIRDEYDYNYRMRIDNRVMERLASYIREDFYAFTLLLATLRDLGAQEIQTSLQKIKDLEGELAEQSYMYLKVGCVMNELLLGDIANQFMMDQVVQSSGSAMLDEEASLSELTLRLKLGSFRLGRSTLIAFKTSQDEVLVIYYSSSQLECTTTNFTPFPSYSYIFNTRTKTSNCDILRGLIHQNIKPIFPHPQNYEDLGQVNFSLTFFCSEELETELILSEQSADLQTGQSSIVASHKDDSKRTIPLIQMAFLPQDKLPLIDIEHNQLKLYNLEQLLEGDSKNHILDPVRLGAVQVNCQVFQKIALFTYPEEYWFKRVMIYHRGRLISHFKQSDNRLCGIIELSPQVQLDLGATNVARVQDRMAVENLLHDIRSFKRTAIS